MMLTTNLGAHEKTIPYQSETRLHSAATVVNVRETPRVSATAFARSEVGAENTFLV